MEKEKEILAMRAGRKLDWEVRHELLGVMTDAYTSDGDLWDQSFQPAPRHSSELNAAEEVVKALNAQGFNVHLMFRTDGKAFVTVNKVGNIASELFEVTAAAPTAAEAVCKAAVLAAFRGKGKGAVL